MKIKQVSYIVILLISIWSCQNNNEVKPTKSKQLKTPVQEEKNIQYFLNLPNNKYSINKLDEDDFYLVSLNDNIKSHLKYYDYYFDTTINSSTFQFYYHCLAGENSESINRRFLNEINKHFGEMIESSKEERHIYYSSLCDSLVEYNGKYLYKRFQSICLGGQSLSRSEYFKFSSLNDLYSTINFENNSIENQNIMQSRRIKKIIWM